jgi:hypothetical protein
MKTLNEKYAENTLKYCNGNRKRHSRTKTILLRIATTLAIGAATYYASRYVGR